MSEWFALYPYAGGGRASCRALLPGLAGRPCHFPSLPGRDERFSAPAHQSFAALADDAWRQLISETDQGRSTADLVLYGYSMGGLLAAELAHRLQEQRSSPPRAVVVAGACAPHLLPHDSLAQLPDEAFVAALVAVGVLPAEVWSDAEAVALFLPTWRADCAAVESHPRERIRLHCPVLAIGGVDDALVDAAGVHGWSDVGGPGSRTFLVPGNHAGLMHDPRPVLRVLRSLLTEPATPAPAQPEDDA